MKKIKFYSVISCPNDIVLFSVPDEWVLEHELKPTKEVLIPKLDQTSKDALNPSLFPEKNNEQVRQKHRRKPIIKRS